MIKEIVDADDKAKALEKQVLSEKEKLNSEIEQEAKKIYDDYMKAAKETVKKNDAEEEKSAKNKLDEIKTKHNSVEIKLNQDYELNCDKWVNQIVSNVLTD